MKRNELIRKIVTGTKSEAFGKNSCFYIGWAQGNNSEQAVKHKIAQFKAELIGKDFQGKPINSFFTKKARFTIKHYQDKGFTGGFFQQWDEHPRSCTTLDYTPETLPEVLDSFKLWMAACFDTRRITIIKGKKMVYEEKREKLRIQPAEIAIIEKNFPDI